MLEAGVSSVNLEPMQTHTHTDLLCTEYSGDGAVKSTGEARDVQFASAGGTLVPVDPRVKLATDRDLQYL